MNPFGYERPTDPAAAVALLVADKEATYLGGGTNLVDHLRLGIVTPGTLVDVTRLGLDRIEATPEGGLRIGTNVRNSDFAAHPVVRQNYPALTRALLAGASGQIRNQATTGGNLLQRTRCVYFQDRTTPCNKRESGSGCSADDDRAYTRYNAVLGTSKHCVAVHPSDLAVALTALDARVVVLGRKGERRIGVDDLYRLPKRRPERDTELAHGDLITAVELPADPAAARSTYVKVRDRASYAFALVSVAAALVLDGDIVTDVRLAWGGVAHKPWRARAAEKRLRGSPLTSEAVRQACAAELRSATTRPGNAYKPTMVTNATDLALQRLREETA